MGGYSFSLENTFSASREWDGIPHAGTIAVRPSVTRTTAISEIKCGPRLEVHTSLDRTRIRGVCLLVGTIAVGREGVFVVIRGV